MKTITFKEGINKGFVRAYEVFAETDMTESMNYHAKKYDLRKANFKLLENLPDNKSALSPNLFACASITGQISRFIRSYSHTMAANFVYEIDNAIVDSHSEVILSRDLELFSEYTPQRTHIMIDGGGGRYRALRAKLRQLKYKRAAKKAMHNKAQTLKGRTLYISREGLEDNYGHFLCDYLGPYHLFLLAQSRYNLKDFDHIILNTSAKWQRDMYEVLGIDSSKIIPALPQRLFYCEELVTTTLSVDWEHVDYDYFPHFAGLGFNPHVYDLYTPYLKRDDTLEWEARPKYYMTRHLATRRHVVNDDEVIEVYKQYGYEIIEPEALGLRGQMDAMANARVISALHGAGSANMYFTRPDCLYFEIFPNRYPDTYFFSSQVGRDAPYAYMVADLVEKDEDPQFEDARIDIDELKMALDRIELWLNQNRK